MHEPALVYGFHVVEAMLAAAPQRVHELYLQEGRKDTRLTSLVSQAKKLGINFTYLARSDLDKKVSAVHQGIIASCAPLMPRGEQELPALLNSLESSALLLVLDGVTDPHNLGACMRSALAAGAQAVLVPRDKSASLSPTARKVSCGASELLPLFQLANLSRALRLLKENGVWLVGMDGAAESSLYELDLKGSIALLLGAEGKGIRDLSRKNCDYLTRIPMNDAMESLNVSVAAGVCLFEAVRQRT